MLLRAAPALSRLTGLALGNDSACTGYSLVVNVQTASRLTIAPPGAPKFQRESHVETGRVLRSDSDAHSPELGTLALWRLPRLHAAPAIRGGPAYRTVFVGGTCRTAVTHFYIETPRGTSSVASRLGPTRVWV